jgi:membrane protein implicated in regulation of membrane protease activity
MSAPLRLPAFVSKCGCTDTYGITNKDAMAQSSIWWLLAGAAVAIELVTGTFYLLMLAMGLSAAAVAAHVGLSSTLQVAIAAVVGGGSVLVWRSIKLKQPQAAPATANRDVNLDIGETVHVLIWQADGTGTVNYRGAHWSVSHRPGSVPTAGAHRIVEVIGSRLVVEKI